MGPMTGRGMGLCVGIAPGAGAGPGMGRGMGYGGGYGRGYGNRGARCYGGYGGRLGTAPVTDREEKEWLKAEEQILNRNLREVRGRLSRLGEDSDAKA